MTVAGEPPVLLNVATNAGTDAVAAVPGTAVALDATETLALANAMTRGSHDVPVPIEVSAIEQKMPSPSPLQVFSLETLRAADVEIREAEAHLRAARSALSLTFAADAEQVRRS